MITYIILAIDFDVRKHFNFAFDLMARLPKKQSFSIQSVPIKSSCQYLKIRKITRNVSDAPCLAQNMTDFFSVINHPIGNVP